MTEDVEVAEPRTSTGTLKELYLALVWLGTSMWAAHATLKGQSTTASGTLADAAAALPGIVAATLVTGAALGSAAGSRFEGPVKRLLAGVGIGALFGLLAAAGLRFGYGTQPAIMTLAITVGAASVIGGALAILPESVLSGGLWATTFVFLAGVCFGAMQVMITTTLGGGPTADAAAQATATARFILGQSIATGLIAGYFSRRNPEGGRFARPWFLLVGALPGLFLLGAEALTRMGGASVVNLLNGIPANEPNPGELNGVDPIKHGLIVLAIGAVVAFVTAPRDRD
jgi:hypothetical protein